MNNSAIRCSCYLAAVLALLAVVRCPWKSFAQTESGSIYGRVSDQSGAVIPNAEVKLHNIDTNVDFTRTTNQEGFYLLPALKPGRYLIVVGKQGFKTVTLKNITLNVQDNISRNFSLEVGSASESVTVNAEAATINTTDATVSTVVDRQFAENLPLNGRSFQALVELAPGVVTTPSNSFDSGQFSVNGQRPSSNYWMVDGVSANIGMSSITPGNGFSGAVGSVSVLGGTNSLVSVDALQEFRILTSTYAPEFGRTPGGQISILTRSGTNQLHGTLFDYFRNDVLDANDWFANSKGLRKPEERQNDFGGTFSGPVFKNRTFFFFSYEGLRLRLPQTVLTTVPDVPSRQSALPTMQPYLNAFPIPNGPEVVDSQGNPTGIAQFNAGISNKATLDAYSLRIDHKLNAKLNFFGRYNYSPSEILQRGHGSSANTVIDARTSTHTSTVGATWAISPTIFNELRFNYSQTDASSKSATDNFGGASALPSLGFPSPFNNSNAFFMFSIVGLTGSGGGAGELDQGKTGQNVQHQYNLVDSLSTQWRSHSLKFGIDFRRLSPQYNNFPYAQEVLFFGVPAAQMGDLFFGQVVSNRKTTSLFRNLGIYAQDTWRIVPRFTLTYGLRWDVDFSPSSVEGPNFPAATGFNLSNLAQLALAPPGTPPFRTSYLNLAPRLGMAYQVSESQRWQTVLRAGFGIFFDLATQEAGNILQNAAYPFGSTNFLFGGTFPLDSTAAAPLPIVPPGPNGGELAVFDPRLKLPYTIQWSIALEQALGKSETLSASYIGSKGERLIQSTLVFSPNPNLGTAYLVTNQGTANYHALQVQFERRLSDGLQALISYTWSHSIDTASAGSEFGSFANDLVPGLEANRGPSDFDIRHALSAAVTYEIPVRTINNFTNAILKGWSIESTVQARSAPPVDVSFLAFGLLRNANATVRPDVVPGLPLYLFGPQFPGGKAFNNTPGAVVGGCPDGSPSIGPFCPPPIDPSTGQPLRHGNLGRNALRGFGATQWDFSVHRNFSIHDALRLEFRAELFNILNHPNFGPPSGFLDGGGFGLSSQTLGQSLAGNIAGGAFNPLYQIGGPRSVQLALKLKF